MIDYRTINSFPRFHKLIMMRSLSRNVHHHFLVIFFFLLFTNHSPICLIFSSQIFFFFRINENTRVFITLIFSSFPFFFIQFRLVGPMIDPFSFPKHIQQGMRARLVCTIIQGDPPFTIKWFKNEEPIDPTTLNLGIRSDDFSSDLTFQRLSTRHNGNYTCVVRNDVASASHSASLVVEGNYFMNANLRAINHGCALNYNESQNELMKGSLFWYSNFK